MKTLSHLDPEIASLTDKEYERLENTIDLIAAENTPPPGILELAGSILNVKTIEGYPGKRFHAGCEYVDQIEQIAIERGKTLFGAEHVNVQPHSGTSANLAVYFASLNVGDKILAMSLPHGGHLSHGHRASITSKCFEFYHYTVDEESEIIDYEQIYDLAQKHKPQMLVAGASAYPRLIDYKKMHEIAKSVSAYLLVDMAHIAGLVAGQVIPSPVPWSDFVTFTSYKTMMGGRGGIILSNKDFAKKIDSTVFPGIQGTSPVSYIAAKGTCFKMALESPLFSTMQQRTVDSAKNLAQTLETYGYRIVTGGTDNHQVIVDVGKSNMEAGECENALEKVGIMSNRNFIPSDNTSGNSLSGIRLGTSSLVRRGMDRDIEKVGKLIHNTLSHSPSERDLNIIKQEVYDLCKLYPLYTQI